MSTKGLKTYFRQRTARLRRLPTRPRIPGNQCGLSKSILIRLLGRDRISTRRFDKKAVHNVHFCSKCVKKICRKAGKIKELAVCTIEEWYICTEEKAKVVSAFWGTDLLQFLSALAICTRMSWRKCWFVPMFYNSSWCNSAYSSNRPVAKYLARQGIETIQPPKKQRRPLPSLLYKSFFYDLYKRNKNLQTFFKVQILSVFDYSLSEFVPPLRV